MAQILCALLFFSGMASLIFETLWFRRAGLVFGNGVWASALVLSSFMAGLALGNALAARFAHRVRRPVRAYAAIELVIAAAGLGLVVLLPRMTGWLSPLFRSLVDTPALLNAVVSNAGQQLALGFFL